MKELFTLGWPVGTELTMRAVKWSRFFTLLSAAFLAMAIIVLNDRALDVWYLVVFAYYSVSGKILENNMATTKRLEEILESVRRKVHVFKCPRCGGTHHDLPMHVLGNVPYYRCPGDNGKIYIRQEI